MLTKAELPDCPVATTLQLIGNVVVPTYIVVPLGGGNLSTYFALATVCMLLAAVVCFLFMKTCGAFDKKRA